MSTKCVQSPVQACPWVWQQSEDEAVCAQQAAAQLDLLPLLALSSHCQEEGHCEVC